jgi:hypothetical protein
VCPLGAVQLLVHPRAHVSGVNSGLSEFLRATNPDTGWLTLMCAAILLYLSLAPTPRPAPAAQKQIAPPSDPSDTAPAPLPAAVAPA